VEKQSFQNYELIVVDDGSIDETLPWLQATYPQAVVHAMEKPGGAALARNRGIEIARGELIAFLDDDDVWLPHYLTKQVENMKAYPAAVLSYSDYVEMDASGHSFRPDTQPLLPYESVFVRLLAECFIHTLSIVVCRREAFDRFGRFDERLHIVHDLDWYQRILVGGGSFAYLPHPLVRRGIPGGLVTSHRRWFEEEHNAHSHALIGNPVKENDKCLIRTYRSLFFAHIALSHRDWSFGFFRLIAAFLQSPLWTMRIAGLRLLRRMRFDRKAAL
jgi:glycosyltransferase involved in cell wall biosynthesis